jgi:hypothetical protein
MSRFSLLKFIFVCAERCSGFPEELCFLEYNAFFAAFTVVSCSDYSSALKMEAKYSSEISIDFERTARHYNREGGTLRNHSCETFESYDFSRYFDASL